MTELSLQQRSARPAGRTLGIPAKIAAARGQAFDKYNADTWQMHRRAAGLLAKFKRDTVLSNGKPGYEFVYRVVQCHRGLHGLPPEIWCTKAGDRAEYRDVQTCSSVWLCVFCAPKISSKRRDEMNAASAVWTESGGGVYLATFTHSHSKDERPLAEQDKLMRQAYSKFTGSREFRKVMKRAFSAGAVRAIEVTHGEWHGWHPHVHALWFCGPELLCYYTAANGERRLSRHCVFAKLRGWWVRQLIKRGLSGLKPGVVGVERRKHLRDLLDHALHIQDGKAAAEYIAKFGIEPRTESGGRWGIGSEMTKGHLKRSERLYGRTPFELLRRATFDSDKHAAMLWREYAVVFYGRRQLWWSSGLRQVLIEQLNQSGRFDMFTKLRLLAILRREKDDPEIAEQPDRRCDVKVMRLSFGDWYVVLSRDKRFELLKVAAEEGEPGARRYLDKLRGQPPTHSGDYEDDGAFLIPIRKFA